MKSCPTCNRTYSEDRFSFCLVDGAILSAPYDSDKTQVLTDSYPSYVLPPTEVIKFDQPQNEEVIEFIGNDEDYLLWLKNNPKGFVINTPKSKRPTYMSLHKATCPHISMLEDEHKGGWTERAYIKICSREIDSLRDWVKEHGRPDGSFTQECQTCKPIKRVTTTPEEYTLENLPGTITFLKANRTAVQQVLQEITRAGRMSTEELNSRLRRKVALRLALIGLLECDNFAWGYGKLRHYRINPHPLEGGVKLLEEIYQQPTVDDNWHGYVSGQQVNASEVVAKCLQHINSGKVQSPEQKLKGIEAISKYGQSVLVFSPKGKGWGSSPMNPNCWHTAEGRPIT